MAKKTPAVPQKTLFNPEAGLEELGKAAKHCKACDLWKRGTQTVFGEGESKAKVMLVGEQPGNQEDLEGKPFVGPAGKLLDAALEEAGIDRGKVYVTNAVKHFKWEPRGKRRIHKKPNAVEIAACRQWLDGEMAALKPKVIVCLGATAAQALILLFSIPPPAYWIDSRFVQKSFARACKAPNRISILKRLALPPKSFRTRHFLLAAIN